MWICAIKTALGQKCDTAEGVPVEKVTKILQPVMIVPLPAPNCQTDWNYNEHGNDWVCRCNEGLEQSPIDMPFGSSLELLKFGIYLGSMPSSTTSTCLETRFTSFTKLTCSESNSKMTKMEILSTTVSEPFTISMELFIMRWRSESTHQVNFIYNNKFKAEHTIAGHTYKMEI